MKRRLIILLLFLAATSGAAFGEKIIYVDTKATGANNGLSWEDAYKYIQDALADANSSSKPVEIRVAQGIYRPDETSAEPNGTGDREATFQLINGVTLKGGYAGPRMSLSGADPNARDVDLYETILSGDLDDNDIDVNDPALLLWEPTRAENSYHVVTGNRTEPNSILDGFTITGGNANGPQQNDQGDGGGMYNDSGSPTIRNCTFSRNSAERIGGGIFNGYGNPILLNCMVNWNWGFTGGGMYNYHSSPTLAHCIFNGNWAEYGGGGGMYNYWCSSPTLINCIFSRNWTSDDGGGMSNHRDSYPTLTNCTFNGNSAEQYYGSGMYNSDSYPILINCILWGDISGEIYTETSHLPPVITYSNVEGGCDGLGNIDTDPCFADAFNGDYHLKSQAGRWDPTKGRWTKDEVTSPCIDTGDPHSPIGLEPFPNGGIINMGAYGGTAEASKSYFGKPVCETIVAGDINGDCILNLKDFALIAFHWLEEK